MASKNTNLKLLTKQDIKRFWSYVNKEGPIIRPELGRCWVWTGHCHDRGYGILQIMGDRTRPTGWGLSAHRISYTLHLGHPGELNVLHHCDNPPCVRPEHLFKGTHVDNVADRTAKGRSSKGSKMWRSIFTDEQVLRIRGRLAAGERQSDIAREFGTPKNTIYAIHHRITWKHI